MWVGVVPEAGTLVDCQWVALSFHLQESQPFGLSSQVVFGGPCLPMPAPLDSSVQFWDFRLDPETLGNGQ